MIVIFQAVNIKNDNSIHIIPLKFYQKKVYASKIRMKRNLSTKTRNHILILFEVCSFHCDIPQNLPYHHTRQEDGHSYGLLSLDDDILIGTFYALF